MTRRTVWVALIALLALAGLAALAHRPLLRATGQALVVDDPRERADAIVVVAGSTPSREETAAGLYREGWAPRVLVSRQLVPGRTQRLIDMGVRRLDFQGESVAALEKYGVPRDAIVALDQPVEITETELRAVAAAARDRGWRRLILVTSAFHARRVQVIWRRESGGHRGPPGGGAGRVHRRRRLVAAAPLQRIRAARVPGTPRALPPHLELDALIPRQDPMRR